MNAATAFTGRYPIHSHPTCADWADLALTPREHQALTFIAGYISDHGFAPTLVEICDGIGAARSRGRAHALVTQLEQKKAIRRVRGQDRGIVLVDRPVDLSSISDAAIATEYARRFAGKH
ncbi:LexA family protein [Sphingomonas sp.]|uniref:LexA family protein n=1 Tax=Sphingomonas sp. TaxID=28214 RepID=UPI003B3ABD37